MAQIYRYINGEYSNMAEVNAAAEAEKQRIDANPCDFVEVKLLSGSADSGWVIPQEKLTNEQVLAITGTDTGFYQVNSIADGDTTVGLNATEALAEIKRLTRKYGTRMNLGKTFVYGELDVGVDMSDYITPE